MFIAVVKSVFLPIYLSYHTDVKFWVVQLPALVTQKLVRVIKKSYLIHWHCYTAVNLIDCVTLHYVNHKRAEVCGIFKEKPSVPSPLLEQIQPLLKVTTGQDRSKLFEDIDS